MLSHLLKRTAPTTTNNAVASLRLFLSTTSSRNAGSTEIKKVTVIGGGHMGAGIVQLNAQNGYDVTVLDTDEFLQKCLVQIAKSLDNMKKIKFPDEPLAQNNWRSSVLGNIKTKIINNQKNFQTACQDSDLVIESIVEDLDVKRTMFSKIDSVVSKRCLIASNTSALKISDISSGVSHPERVVGLHFFTPVWRMRLVEVIAMPQTSRQTKNNISSYIESVGKIPVPCNDSTGSIVNGFLYKYFMDAIQLHEETGVPISDIDRAMKLGAGLPQGPFELMDRIGIDIIHQVVSQWHQKEPDDPRFVPTATLEELIVNRRLGRKSSRGFYDYR